MSYVVPKHTSLSELMIKLILIWFMLFFYFDDVIVVLLLMLMMLQAQQGAKADLSVGAAYKPHQPLGSAALQLRTEVFNCSLLARLTTSLKIPRMVNKFQMLSLESTAAAERLADYSRDSPLLGRCRSLSLSLSSSSACQTSSSLSKA